MDGMFGEVPAPLPGRSAFLSEIRRLTPPANFDTALRASASRATNSRSEIFHELAGPRPHIRNMTKSHHGSGGGTVGSTRIRRFLTQRRGARREKPFSESKATGSRFGRNKKSAAKGAFAPFVGHLRQSWSLGHRSPVMEPQARKIIGATLPTPIFREMNGILACRLGVNSVEI